MPKVRKSVPQKIGKLNPPAEESAEREAQTFATQRELDGIANQEDYALNQQRKWHRSLMFICLEYLSATTVAIGLITLSAIWLLDVVRSENIDKVEAIIFNVLSLIVGTAFGHFVLRPRK